MKIIQRTALLALIGSVMSINGRLNEHQKENFFNFMMDSLDGRDFLSTIANKVMDRTQHHLLFNLAPLRSQSGLLGSVGGFLECQTCKLTVSGLDS